MTTSDSARPNMDRDSIIAHIPRLRRYARLLTGDAHRADDLVQDTLERAMVKWALWQPGHDAAMRTLQLRAWLFTVMHNLFVNQLRGKAQSAAREAVSMDDVDVEGPGRDPGLRLDMERALRQLPHDQLEVLLLVGLEDFSYAEAAILIDVPIGTVMSRLSRARKRLAELMEGAPVRTARPQLKVMK